MKSQKQSQPQNKVRSIEMQKHITFDPGIVGKKFHKISESHRGQKGKNYTPKRKTWAFQGAYDISRHIQKFFPKYFHGFFHNYYTTI
jgi:hypothetical protein